MTILPGSTVTWSLKPGNPKNISRSVALVEISKAFSEWSGFINLTFVFVEDYDSAKIKVSFEDKNHRGSNEDEDFDGEGGILAHATPPGVNPFIHFDNEEKWITEDSGLLENFFTSHPYLKAVASHEIGHVLGLAHRSDFDSIMNTSYSKLIYSPSETDVELVRSIFGKGPKDPKKISYFEYFLRRNYVLIGTIMLSILISSGILTKIFSFGKRNRISN